MAQYMIQTSMNVFRLLFFITTILFSANQSHSHHGEKYKYIEKYKCTSPAFEKYLLSEYRKYNSEMCFIDFAEETPKGTVIVLNFYDKKYGIDLVWGKLDIKNYNIFLYGKYSCGLFKKMNKRTKVNLEKYKDEVDENGYLYMIDDGIMTSVLYNDEGVFEMDWVNRSLQKIGN